MIYAINCQGILYQIISTNTEEINILCQKRSHYSSSRGFNHDAYQCRICSRVGEGIWGYKLIGFRVACSVDSLR